MIERLMGTVNWVDGAGQSTQVAQFDSCQLSVACQIE